MSPARVTRLSTTAIKGLALHHPAEIELQHAGAAGDRDFFLVDDRDRLVSIMATGRLVHLKSHYEPVTRWLSVGSASGEVWEGEVILGAPVTADFFAHRNVTGRVVHGPWNEIFSALVGRALRLVQASEPGGGTDVHPVTLLAEESVAELARRSEVPTIDARRFRMLIDFAGVEPHAEDSWRGRTVEVGGTLLQIGGPVPRCAATTRDPEHGQRDLPVVKMIRQYRGLEDTELGPGAAFGVYADVLREGTVRVGDVLAPVPA